MATGLYVLHAMFLVAMAWKYGDVFVIILNQGTTVVTAVNWESRLNLETVAEHHAQVSISR
jgi:hypothetical protein